MNSTIILSLSLTAVLTIFAILSVVYLYARAERQAQETANLLLEQNRRLTNLLVSKTPLEYQAITAADLNFQQPELELEPPSIPDDPAYSFVRDQFQDIAGEGEIDIDGIEQHFLNADGPEYDFERH